MQRWMISLSWSLRESSRTSAVRIRARASSLGCPATSYPGLLSMVATGALHPERLVESLVDVSSVTDVLNRMTEYRTNGFNVITSWTAAARPAAV
ncbi:MAG: hypothetical protein A3H96_27215 [Acidobacteria bacterium RIFCSPLOWO2_02_FULL_67_36]|nr:MAG: hypothetical protein A3H96_27215 [Acidobacteria bacterium RIFCSPLOWO2_02_FULL_67_36]OFW24555.1 MAG: hypothetical protein A3G21_18560 [Acidobacteria bacterium RIFCSPLOWO2_12_FULL_66_21]